MPDKEWELQAHVSTELNRLGILHHGDQNMGKRGPGARAMMKATGACKGWPDMTILLYLERIVYIEFKAGKGRLSSDQEKLHKRMSSLGFPVYVVQSDCRYGAWKQVKEILEL